MGEFRGFGLGWPWPIVNLILGLQFLGQLRPQTGLRTQKTGLKNKETWTWTDCEGNERRIEVHREVEST